MAGKTIWASALLNASHSPRQRRIDKQHAGARLDEILEADVDAARPGHPVELGVEQPEPDQPEPEDRHRIAEQAEEAHEMVRPAPSAEPRPPRPPARRRATPITVAIVASSSVAGKKCRMSEATGFDVITE